MPDFFVPGMRLYLDELIDWQGLLTLRQGDGVDVEAEVGAYRTILETAAALAESFQPAAREHWAAEAELTPDGGAVSPPHIRDAYDKLREAGLVSLSVSETYGGYGLPALLNGMVLEMISRADPSLMMVVGLQTGAAADIEKYGSEETKRQWLPRFVSGEVQGCMDLTEPRAGSDLGGIAARATDLPDGSVRVDGQKIFISNGGAEVHLVLARDDDSFEASKGTTNGLSLLLVPRHRDDGSPNGVRVPRLEHKLGIHGSATCEVVFEGALGTRLGTKGQGFRAMLELMNNARLGVASQSLGLCDAALWDAVTYARQREQFGKPIAKQPLVQAMLTRMIVNTEGVRALLYRTYNLLDGVLAREALLRRNDVAEVERVRMQEELERDVTRVRLLTPLCKYYATEVCSDLTRDAMQVFGGIGFTMDAHVAKLHADSLIMTIYEGTSEIQASFALREMGKGALAVVFREVRAELDTMDEDPVRATLARCVREATIRVEDTLKVLFSDLSYALLRAKLLAAMVIDVVTATELLKQVEEDASRIDIAEDFIRRRMLAAEYGARRIEGNHEGHVERDARIVEWAARA
ncbi:MAG: acyl-CoA dehydrogenase family protein [Myxococcales bacterium]|nr:acyl-CoA dehydrogenase family protein [Myxococcales bacterium]MDH5307375.1 acyl-CoA dehydrogenase family protein [Myxococcales bacterium]